MEVTIAQWPFTTWPVTRMVSFNQTGIIIHPTSKLNKNKNMMRNKPHENITFTNQNQSAKSIDKKIISKRKQVNIIIQTSEVPDPNWRRPDWPLVEADLFLSSWIFFLSASLCFSSLRILTASWAVPTYPSPIPDILSSASGGGVWCYYYVLGFQDASMLHKSASIVKSVTPYFLEGNLFSF